MAHPTGSQIREAGGLAAEYAALVDGAGLADGSDVGRLRITGYDALDLLNRLTTNKLEELLDGHARLTVLTNGDARVIDVLGLAAVDGALLCLTSPGRADAVIDWLDTYTFGEDITVADRTAETAQLTLAGPEAVGVLATAGVDGIPAALDRVTQVTIAGVGVTLWRTMTGGAEGFEVIVERADADAVRAALAAADATPVSARAWEAFRIANGMPAYGSEFGEATNPLESRLRGAISEDKGCYTGQEVVARLLTYGKVQRRLMSRRGPRRPCADRPEARVGGERIRRERLVRRHGHHLGAGLRAGHGARRRLSQPRSLASAPLLRFGREGRGAEPLCRGHGGVPRPWLLYPLPGQEGDRAMVETAVSRRRSRTRAEGCGKAS